MAATLSHSASSTSPASSASSATPSALSSAPSALSAAPAASGATGGAASTVSRRRWLTLAVLCLSLLITVVDGTIVNVALPTLARDLRTGISGLQWITDAYTLTFAALLLLAGAIADRWGRHRALAAGLAVFAAGSLAATLTHTAAELIAARAVMGTGAAFIMPATLAILTSVFTSPRERAKAIGIWSAVSGLGVAIGPVAGGFLLAHFGWQSVFAVNLPLTAVALAAGHWLVPASKSALPRRLDPLGAILSVAGFTALTWTLIEAPSRGWLSFATLAEFSGAGALLVSFVMIEARSDHPMLPLALVRDRRIAAGAMALALAFFALGGTVFLTTQIYQLVLGYSPLSAGLRALPSAIAIAAAAPVGAQAVKRAGAAVPITAGLLLVAGGLSFFATATPTSGYAHFVIAMVAVAAGIGLTMSAATSVTLQQLPPALAGVGSAVNDATRNMGTVLGVAVVGSVAASAAGGHVMPAHGALTASGPAARSAADAMHTAAAAFITGADHGAIVAAALVFAGALLAPRLLRRT